MTDTLKITPHQPAVDDPFTIIGTDAFAADSRPVGVDSRAVIGVFADLAAVRAAVERLAAAGLPLHQVSMLAKDLRSQIIMNGYVTTGDVAGPGAAAGAWVSGLHGLLAGSAFLSISGVVPLIVLGPLAEAATGTVQGALVAGGVAVILGHFVAKHHLPEYERIVQAGGYLLAAYGTEQEAARAQQLFTDAGGSNVQRHDQHRGRVVETISSVVEGMRVFDAAGKRAGRVKYVKLGDPEAITALGQEADDGEPRVTGELRERLLRLGFIRIDREGFLKSGAYVAADEIDRVQDGTVHLTVTDEEMLTKAGV